MTITHLPPGLVGLLNAIFWGQQEYEDELSTFLDTWDNVKNWHAFHGSYSVDEKEQGELDNFLVLWDQVNSVMESEEPIEFEKLATPLYDTVRIMERINGEREIASFSPIPAVNETLLSTAAFCMDRGTEEGLRDRLPMLAECLDNLRGLCFEQQENLPEEIEEALMKGFDAVETGIRQLHEKLPDKDAAQEAFANIKDGASLVEFLLEWDRKEKERLKELYSRFNIPIIGTELEIGFESTKMVGRQKWRRGAKETEEEFLPQLEEFWNSVKHHLFLVPEEREELVANVEESILSLKDAIAALKEEEGSDEEVLGSLEEALEWCSESFTNLQDSTLRPEVFGQNPEKHIFEASRGVLAGTVPDAALVELLNQTPAPDESLPGFQAFINEGDTEQLYAAVWAMYDAVEAREEAREAQSSPTNGHADCAAFTTPAAHSAAESAGWCAKPPESDPAFHNPDQNDLASRLVNLTSLGQGLRTA